MATNSRAYTLAGFTLLFFLGILGTLFFLADLRQLGDVISHLDTRFLILALLVTTLSYFLNYMAFQGLARAVEAVLGGNAVRFWRLDEVGESRQEEHER